MNSLSYYTNLITSQYKTKPNFMAWLNVLLTPFNDCQTLLNEMYSYFDIDNAVGIQLDYLGILIGQTRKVTITQTTVDEVIADIDTIEDWDTLDTPTGNLNDDNYRFLLKAKIIMNNWDGTIPSLVTAWKNLFANSTINIYDNQNMSMTITLGGDFTNLERALIVSDYIIPRPAGVQINYYFGTLPIFGFDLDTTQISGFDKGSWLTTGGV